MWMLISTIYYLSNLNKSQSKIFCGVFFIFEFLNCMFRMQLILKNKLSCARKVIKKYTKFLVGDKLQNNAIIRVVRYLIWLRKALAIVI